MPDTIEELGRDESYIKPVQVQTTERKGLFVIQLGAFSDAANAARLRKALVNNTVFYRVRIGDFNAFEAAQEKAERLGQEGYTALVLKAE